MINDTLFGIVIVNRSDMAAKARQSGKTRRIAATTIFSPAPKFSSAQDKQAHGSSLASLIFLNQSYAPAIKGSSSS
ncbi:hypothetical protein [Rhizobium leguminosarum]|uniref:hypothetical protein n=1 Tax=Rhizobium leguminosarum TaxID=384 RepID=UPI0014428403|nr:hypothetical protein [Rhizobium leguminosarum]MBY5793215.1 hypothetical protein [Rhizobium leguminosarum]